VSGGGLRALPWHGWHLARERKAPDAADIAIEGAASKPLTSAQRQKLAALSARAFAFQGKLGMWDGDADAFRHAAVQDLCGKAGVSALCQREYGPACRMFLKLAGAKVEERPATRAGRSAAKDPARDDADRARRKLLEETFAQAAAFGGQPGAQGYAEQLLGRIHKTDLQRATARQLWQVLFTLRNRARAKARKIAQEAPEEKSGAESAKPAPALSRAFAGGFRGDSGEAVRGNKHSMRPDGREGG